LIGWAAITNELQKGKLDPRLKEYLLAARLIGIPKPDKSARPIAVGEAIFKLGAIHAVTKLLPAARKYFGPDNNPLQTCFMLNACEIGVHTTQALLDAGYTLNAYNEGDRPKLVKSLLDAKELSSVHPIAYWSYATASPLFVLQGGKVIETIMSTTGTRQGCPLGGLVFAAGLQPALRAAAAANPNAKTSAYLDDVKFAAKNPLDVIAPFLKFEEEAKILGLVVRYQKCKLFWMRDDPIPDELRKFVEERGIPVETRAGIVLGAPVGRNAEAITRITQDIVNEHDRFFKLLRHDKLSHQDAMLILAKSGVPRMSYIARCVRPDLIEQPLADFDSKIQAVATHRIPIASNHPKSLAARTQLALPVRLGGFGLRPSAPYRHFAWLGAFAAASPLLSKLIGDAPTPQLVQSLDTALAGARSRIPHASGARKMLPASALDSINFFNREGLNAVKLQKLFTSAAEQQAFDNLKASPDMSPDDLARLHSLQGAWAGWPAIIPFTSQLRLDNEHYVLLAKARLGYPILDKLPHACKCGKKFSDHPLHGLHCVLFLGQLVSHRHDEVVKILARYVRLVRGFVRELDRDRYHWGAEMRPDLEVILGVLRELIDVTIRHPTTPVPGAASVAAVAQKEKLYRELASKAGAQLTPFVIETFGAWDSRAREFVARIRAHNDVAVTGMSKHDIFYALSCEVAIAVQRGNARSLLACLQSALSADSVQFPVSINGIPRSSA